MGLFKASILTLMVAISIPLIYRHFIDDQTLKTLNSYHPSFKNVDRFLRKSANHIDSAKEYLPSKQEVQDKLDYLIKTAGSYANDLKSTVDKAMSSKDNQPEANEKPKIHTPTSSTKSPKAAVSTTPKPDLPRLCQCEDLKGQNVRLWSKQELSKFDASQEAIYLGYLGLVFDVTTNQQHYGQDADYNIFTGKDATKAFITGNFTHDLHDDIGDLDESLYGHLESWLSFYKTTYPQLGRIEGSFYDSRGCPTSLMLKVNEGLRKAEERRVSEQKLERQLPECNSEWNVENKQGRVWCTNKSGGVDRSWVGFPRIFDDGSGKRCVCFNPDSPDAQQSVKLMNVYPGCDPQSSECKLVDQ